MENIDKDLNSSEGLVDLSAFEFILEPVYFKQGFSLDEKMYLREGVAKKLQEVQKSLGGYKLKIWDGYRPRQVQYNIYKDYWQRLRNEHPEWDTEKLILEVEVFIANPYAKGMVPPHSTGGAVDLTLTDADGKELDMGTTFDFFGPEAKSGYFEKNNTNETAGNNRRLLYDAMKDQGFIQYEEEWWHFDYGNKPWADQSGSSQVIYTEVLAGI